MEKKYPYDYFMLIIIADVTCVSINCILSTLSSKEVNHAQIMDKLSFYELGLQWIGVFNIRIFVNLTNEYSNIRLSQNFLS